MLDKDDQMKVLLRPAWWPHIQEICFSPLPSLTCPLLHSCLLSTRLHFTCQLFSHIHSTPSLLPLPNCTPLPSPTQPPAPPQSSPLTLRHCLFYVSLSGGEERIPRGTVLRSRCRLHWLNEEPAGRGECLCVCLRVSECVCVAVTKSPRCVCLSVSVCVRGSLWTLTMRQLWGPKALFASCKSRACRAVSHTRPYTHTCIKRGPLLHSRLTSTALKTPPPPPNTRTRRRLSRNTNGSGHQVLQFLPFIQY